MIRTSDGEVARYRFDAPERLGHDSCRQGGNHATVRRVTHRADGKVGGCAVFDGKGHLDLGYRVSSELHGRGQVTIAAWVKPAAWGSQLVYFPIDSSKSGISVALRPEGHLQVGGRSSRVDEFQRMTFPWPGLDAWHHLAAVIDYPAQTARVWINGEQVQGEGKLEFSNDVYQRHFPTVRDVVGKHYHGAPAFHGCLDDLRFWRRALGPEEIRALSAAE